jgi:hypothetical protein
MAEKSTRIAELDEDPTNFIDMDLGESTEMNHQAYPERTQAFTLQHEDRKDGILLDSTEKAYITQLTHPLKDVDVQMLPDSHASPQRP